MKKILILKIISLVIIISISSIFLSGCYDRREVDELGYVMAIGLDKGTTNSLRMTLQLAVPKAISGGGEGGGGEGGGGKPSLVTTLEAPGIYSGLNMANVYIGREINVSHAKVVAFSEELAREGILNYIHALIRGKDFRGNMSIAVVKGSVEDYIKSVEPVLEISTAKYYEQMFKSYKHTGFTANTQLVNFYSKAEETTEEPVAVLAGVSKYDSADEFTLEDSTYKEKGKPRPFEGDYIAGNMPKIGSIKSELMGLAVFNGSKMVGELDGEESLHYLMIVGQYNDSNITVLDPLNNGYYILLNTSQNRRPVHKVSMLDGNPLIKIKIFLEADILSIQSGINYESTENISILEKAAEEQLKQGMIRLLEKTAKDMESDIFGFGKKIKHNFLTWKEWEDFQWLNKYKDSSFDVDVSFKIRRPGLLIRTIPSISSEGKESG
jgi:spore germination protein KC